MSPAVAVIVPTFNEAGNVEELVRRLHGVLEHDGSHEIVFVDDSSDETPTVVLEVASRSVVPVRLIHRAPGQRTGGLGGAVVEGIRGTDAPTVVVMDGDLQHPPETVPLLLAALAGNDVVVASRYVGEGAADGLSGAGRRWVSAASTGCAKALFPRRLRDCTDPMTGFFALRRAAVDVGRLEPMGFKILLEILVRRPLAVAEVPFRFAERHAGESKADLRQGITFAWQLLTLRLGPMVPFGIVGLSGLVLNLVLMALLMAAGVHYLAAGIVATELSIVSNFVLQERFVFASRRTATRRRHRAWQTLLVNNAETALRAPLLVLAVGSFGADELAAQASLLVLTFGGRFLLLSRLVYRRSGAGRPAGQRRQRYSISGRPGPP